MALPRVLNSFPDAFGPDFGLGARERSGSYTCDGRCFAPVGSGRRADGYYNCAGAADYFFRDFDPIDIWLWRRADCSAAAGADSSDRDRGAGGGSAFDYDCGGCGGTGLAEDPCTQHGLAAGTYPCGDSCGDCAVDEHA